ncbi:MAG: electron transport protein SCO1/SenC [Bacteroidetes bacterium OLB11]|nr:MAG: electron transport protein SCO1/SenC [Bacteroidetes bacterium OLB11]
MFKKIKLKSLFFGALFSFLIPLIAFLIYRHQVLKSNAKFPDFFGAKIDSQLVNGKMQYDTIFHNTRNLELINQLGDTISLNETFKDKILVIDFIFTSCATICPTLTSNMNLLNRAYKKMIPLFDLFLLPLTQSMILYHSSECMQINKMQIMINGFFAQGIKKDIYEFARKELMLTLPDGNGDEDDFIHPDQFVLLDQNRNVRGYYDGLDSNKVRLCAEDIAFLILENNTKKIKK